MKKLKTIFIITLICALFTSCSSEPTYDEGYQEGYEKGYSDGVQEGHDKGFEEASKLVPTPTPTPEAPAEEPETSDVVSSEDTEATVYRGKTGNKYHRQDCRTLKGSGTAITLEEALSQGREPCKICNP